MPFPTEISVVQLARLVGTPDAPLLVDVRTDEDFALDPRMLPASRRHPHAEVAEWAGSYAGRKLVVACQRGQKLSQGAAAWLRSSGVEAESLEGGFEAWRTASLPLVNLDRPVARDRTGRSIWVTRARPKIDRIACPWLIRRFIDTDAVFLFVAPSEVEAVGQRFNATPFDVEDVFWSHRGEACTFDAMIQEFGLATPALERLSEIVRGADTARPDIAPQAAGLLAVSLGFSRMFKDDLAQLDAAMIVYDALYRWCRDATDETHNWPASKVKP